MVRRDELVDFFFYFKAAHKITRITNYTNEGTKQHNKENSKKNKHLYE